MSKKGKSGKIKVLVIAGGILLVAFSQLFEVEIAPSGLVRKWIGKQVEVVSPQAVSYEELVKQVLPTEGKTVLVEWGDMGQKLVKAGAIDRNKFDKNFSNMTEEMREVLEGDDAHQIKFTQENIVFWTDVLWALGLTQKSKVLSEGPMVQNKERTPLANYASTAGWTLGKCRLTGEMWLGYMRWRMWEREN